MIISLLGTVVMATLFIFELNAYFSVSVSTTLVVDELMDEMLRANFNISVHQVQISATCNLQHLALPNTYQIDCPPLSGTLE